MSRVQPPGCPVPFATPFAAKTPGAGQVVSDGLMKSSIVNGAFLKWLVNGFAVVESLQSAGCGGEVRLTSFCSRQVNAVPDWLTCVVFAACAFATPLTPSQPP